MYARVPRGFSLDASRPVQGENRGMMRVKKVICKALMYKIKRARAAHYPVRSTHFCKLIGNTN